MVQLCARATRAWVFFAEQPESPDERPQLGNLPGCQAVFQSIVWALCFHHGPPLAGITSSMNAQRRLLGATNAIFCVNQSRSCSIAPVYASCPRLGALFFAAPIYSQVPRNFLSRRLTLLRAGYEVPGWKPELKQSYERKSNRRTLVEELTRGQAPWPGQSPSTLWLIAAADPAVALGAIAWPFLKRCYVLCASTPCGLGVFLVLANYCRRAHGDFSD